MEHLLTWGARNRRNERHPKQPDGKHFTFESIIDRKGLCALASVTPSRHFKIEIDSHLALERSVLMPMKKKKQEK